MHQRSVFIRQSSTVCSFGSESWTILSPIEQRIKAKIEAVGTPLKDWDISINYGIKTGFNDAFIISGEKRKELIEQDPKSAEIIRPILRGRDIKRYGHEFADLWLINTHNGAKEKGIKSIYINDYPAIKKHLDKYYPELERRQDKGDTPYNLRNCAYIENFYKQKIVWAETIKEYFYSEKNFPRFSFDMQNIFLDKTSFMLVGNDLKFLLGILNSTIVEYYLRQTVVKLGAGSMGLAKIFLELTPIVKPTSAIKKSIENLVDEIIIAKEQSKYTKNLEREIDNLAYKLFDFDTEDIKFIESL